MRILHVTDFFPPVRGGLEGHVDDLTSAQVARGHEVHVATLTPDPTPRDPAVGTHVVRTAAARVLRYADPARPFAPPLPDPVARRELGRLVDAIGPDVVHAHSWLGSSAPRRRRTASVLTAHDYALVCQRRTLVRADGTTCGGPGAAACLACAGRTDGVARAVLLGGGTSVGRRRWGLDAIVTLSEHVASRVRPHVSVPVEVCGGLLPPRPSTAVPLPAAVPARPFVLFAGDPGAHKGIDVLLAAWRAPGMAAVPLVVATTKPLDRQVPDGVTTVMLDRGQMAEAWKRAAVAVVPSVWAEPFGMVAMEALASGTPVVASSVGGLPEIVRDGIDGVLVPAGDAAALADAVRSLFADDVRRREMAAAATAGSHRFGADAVVDRIDAVYERVTELAGARP